MTPVCFHRRPPSFPAAVDSVRTPALAGSVKSSIFSRSIPTPPYFITRCRAHSGVRFHFQFMRRENQQRIFPSPLFLRPWLWVLSKARFSDFGHPASIFASKIDSVFSCLSCREQLLWFNDFHSHLSFLSHGSDFHCRSQWQAFSFADCSCCLAASARVMLAAHKDFLVWLSSCMRRQLWPKLVLPPGNCSSSLVCSDLRVVCSCCRKVSI
jgi:hypothetical protein